MSPYVLVIAMTMSSYDGGVAIRHIPFATATACEKAAQFWDGKMMWNGRTKAQAKCHETGAKS